MTAYMAVYIQNCILERSTFTYDAMSKTQKQVLTSTPNNTTLLTPGISANAASTSGNTIENLVFGRTSFTPVKSISWTVLPRPLGYCSVTITGIPKIRAPCNWKQTNNNRKTMSDILKCVYTNGNQLQQTGKNKHTYQSLSHTNNIPKILDGWSEPFLHIAAEKHSAGRSEISQGSELKRK